jgi:hypothetical protein
VPATDLPVLVFDPRVQPPARRELPLHVRTEAILAAMPGPAQPTAITTAASANAGQEPAKPKFTKQQIAARLRQLKLLYQEGLLTEAFYEEKVSESDTVAP